MNYNNIHFLDSVYSLKNLPDAIYPEVAFSGRSNVGKSSLINKMVNRRNLVKTSSKPGKTQSLNYFELDSQLFLVDLPGYGFAKVSRKVQSSWGELISGYLENRESLACVFVIIDIRHELKAMDKELIDWLRYKNQAFVPVYTKADKLPRGKQQNNALALDKSLNIKANERVLFSSKTGQGCDVLHARLASIVENW